MRKATFLWDELVSDAQRLITVPISSFHRLAEEGLTRKQQIDSHATDLTFLFGTGRCGSTLIAKIVDTADPESLVLSEPVPLIDLYRFHKRLPPSEFQKLTLNTMRLLCKPAVGKRRFFIKPLCLTLPIAREVRRALPKVRLLFCQRDPLKTAWAHERAFGVTLFYRGFQVAQWLRVPGIFESLLGHHRNSRSDDVAMARMPRPCMLEMCFQAWGAHYLSYREQSAEFEFPSIAYETVLTNPIKFCQDILEMSGLEPNKHPQRLASALQALNYDSQEGREISQKQLHGYPVTKVRKRFHF